MVELLRRLGSFLTAMDAKAWTSLLVSTILLVFVILMFAFGQQWLNLEAQGGINQVLFEAAESRFAVFVVISIFVVLALTGFPQILLITATVMAFGARNGALYSWIATMISATVTFGLGHWFGGRFVRRFGGERALSTVDFIGRHGILASALIRVVPSAPFIVVNAAAGAAHIPLWKYWAGTGFGIVPKILLVVAVGAVAPNTQSFAQGVEGILHFFLGRQPAELALLVGVVGAWLAFLAAMRWVYGVVRRRDQSRGGR